MGAYATDFVERTWPVTYGGRGTGRSPEGRSMGLGYPSEGNFDIATPKGGYLWDRCREAGVSYRSYGEFINNGRTPEDPGTTDVEALQDHFDPFFRSYDLSYPDVDRAARSSRASRPRARCPSSSSSASPTTTRRAPHLEHLPRGRWWRTMTSPWAR